MLSYRNRTDHQQKTTQKTLKNLEMKQHSSKYPMVQRAKHDGNQKIFLNE